MILDETQKERDVELSELTGLPLDRIEEIEVCSPDSIRIYDGSRRIADEADYLSLYSRFEYLDLVAYLKTLMFTSVTRRPQELFDLIRQTRGKRCLDFGSGVGSHAIGLMENGNEVSLLDVDGPLLAFAVRRIGRRFDEPLLGPLGGLYYPETALPDGTFDVLICADVLEHVFDPPAELERMARSMKRGGLMHLEVSLMVKDSSGHFAPSIEKWKRRGPAVLEECFEEVAPTIYRRR